MRVQKGFARRPAFHDGIDHPQRCSDVSHRVGAYDCVLLSEPVATLYRSQFSGDCTRNGWVWMGQSAASAAAGRNLNAGGASQPVSAGAQHGGKRVGRERYFIRKAAGAFGLCHSPGLPPALDCAAVSHDARHERVALRGRLGRDRKNFLHRRDGVTSHRSGLYARLSAHAGHFVRDDVHHGAVDFAYRFFVSAP